MLILQLWVCWLFADSAAEQSPAPKPWPLPAVSFGVLGLGVVCFVPRAELSSSCPSVLRAAACQSQALQGNLGTAYPWADPKQW